MNITDVRVRILDTDEKMKAVASITIDNDFVVHDIKIIEGSTKTFIAMPSRKAPDGEYRDMAHPINSTARAVLETAIINKYKECLLHENS